MNPFNTKEQAILLRALEALQRTTGITGHVIERDLVIAEGFRADACVEVEANGQCYRYMAEIKRADRFATLGDIKNQCTQHGDQLLLAAPPRHR